MKKSGFSLVELSIVLVILGLLVGGVLTGQNLVRSAEIRSITEQFKSYDIAVNLFREKYNGRPGDIANATAYWGAAGTCPGTAPAHATTDGSTCNGDANGQTNSFEIYRVWQQLANAGLIEGRYNGVTGGVSNHYTSLIGTNVPAGKVGNGGWSIYNWGPTALVSELNNRFEGSYGNGDIYIYGAKITDHLSSSPVITGQEMWNIDTKMDDGKPGTGTLRAQEVTGNCHDATTSAVTALAPTANYNLSANTISCNLYFLMFP